MRSAISLSVLLLVAPTAWAHPGSTDACYGHTVMEWVEYPANPDGQPSYPSEPGEYHFHFTPEQMPEIRESLSAYKRTHPQFTPLGEDYGSFTVGEHTYDILEYTREQREAILHCQGDDEVTHTGIARIRE